MIILERHDNKIHRYHFTINSVYQNFFACTFDTILHFLFINCSKKRSHGMSFLIMDIKKCQYETAISRGSLTMAITWSHLFGNIRKGAWLCSTLGESNASIADKLWYSNGASCWFCPIYSVFPVISMKTTSLMRCVPVVKWYILLFTLTQCEINI